MVSDAVKYGALGAAVTFVVGLGTAIPGLGLILGPLFTFGGGFAGGGLAGGLYRRGSAEGVKLALAATFVGGITSSLVAVVGGTLLNMFVINADPSTTPAEPSNWVVIAAVGFVSGMILTLLGGLVGGAVGGAITAPDDA